MKIFDALILLLLLVLLAMGSYLFWLNIPTDTISFESFSRNEPVTEFSVTNGSQFYPNMRYRDRFISYTISNSCDSAKIINVEKAFLILEQRTILEFSESEDGEISILCSDIAPKAKERDHFVAGEGGPSEIINTSSYAVIFSGKVSLYRQDKCDEPKVAIHEILHALGFDHNDNPRSIMYPITDCDQEIDQYITDSINNLYKINSNPDLLIEKVNANKTGRYLNFEITVANFGLKDSTGGRIFVYTEEELINSFELNELNIGVRKILTVENLRIPRDAERIKFVVESEDSDINGDNNAVEIELIKMDN